ncbi:MAG: AraC family transcriptional regulator [Velocimicrobium sp.]
MQKKDYEKRGFLQEDFKLFHIKDSALETFDYHYHDFNKIYILISGNVVYNIEGKTYPLLPNDIVLINRNELHKPEINFSVPYERIIVYTNFLEHSSLSYCFQYAKDYTQPVIRLRDLPYTQLFNTLTKLEATIQCNDFANEIYQSALFTEFLVLLNRNMIHKEYSTVSYHSSNNKVHQIIAYINEHIKEDLTVDFLSSHFYVSKYHLMRTFKAETGYSLHHYITNKRLLLACDLLSHDFSIGEVCFQCGFKDYSTFFRAFKKKYNCTPSQLDL